ncbi:MAG TPA: tRNA pseudouridine(55) synthase TruB [Terriglobales bacterium]|nr:tRNA pseudouridine(55) synthase TruB [Terriglobales bacterium]
MNGILIVDKPAGFTSHDVVGRARRILRERSIGHLGTLDPMATGILPLVIGNLTRLAQFYTSREKTYEGVIRFGFATDTYDAKGEALAPAKPVNFSMQQLQKLAYKFVGIIEQTPPPFSAKKIKGVPAYKLARKKQEVALKPVEIEIKELEILDLDNDRASFRARVASGTYIRSIAHDMGQQLGCGAHLESLRRTSVGEFGLSDAHTLEELEAAFNAGNSDELFLHPRKLLPEFPCVTANEEMAARIRRGQIVNLPELSKAKLVKVFEGQKELLAIATRVAGTLFHAKIVLANG